MPTESFYLWFPICKTQAPFDDVRVRQALNFALDNEAMAEALTEGLGEPMEGFWTSESVYFNPDLVDLYPHDPQRAEELLEDARQSGLTFDVLVIPATQRFAEVAQQQWAEAGITANLVPAQDIAQEYFTDVRAPLAAIPINRRGLDKVTRNLTPGSLGNICGYDDPELNALVSELRAAEPASDEAVALWADIQTLAFEQALAVYGIFTAQAYAWSGDLADVRLLPDVRGQLQLDVRGVAVNAS